MPRIVLDQVIIGMVLDKPVTNANGRIMIPAGVEITDKHIKALRMWGIADVSVTDGGDGSPATDPLATIDPNAIEHAKQELGESFKFFNLNHPAAAEIYKQAVMRHARKQTQP